MGIIDESKIGRRSAYADEIARLRELFAGGDHAHGEFRVDENATRDDGKVGGAAKTVEGPVTNDLWRQHLEGKLGLGVVPVTREGKIKWACIDVDAYDGNAAADCAKYFAEHELPFVVCRSKSRGAHCLIFFTDWVDAAPVRTKLAKVAAATGHPRAEIFPKQDRIEEGGFGNWLNMPYFNSEYANIRVALDGESRQLSLPEFLERAEAGRLTFEDFDALLVPEVQRPTEEKNVIEVVRYRPEEGSRNEWLYRFGCKLRRLCADEAEFHRVFDAVATMPGMFGPEDRREVETIKRQVEKNQEPMAAGDFANLVSVTPDPYIPGIDEPYYLLEVRGRRLHVPSYADLSRWQRMKLLIGEQLGFVIKNNQMNANEWENILEGLMDNRVETKSNDTMATLLWAAVMDYVRDNGYAKRKAEIHSGGVFRGEEGYWLSKVQLSQYLTVRPEVRGVTPQKVNRVLAAFGAAEKFAGDEDGRSKRAVLVPLDAVPRWIKTTVEIEQPREPEI